MSSIRLGPNRRTCRSDMTGEIVVPIGNLIGSSGKERSFSGRQLVSLRLGETTIDGPMAVVGTVHGLPDGVMAKFRATATVHMICTKCLTKWDEEISVAAKQYFGVIPDEDGFGITDGEIDMSLPARAELALALPAAPVCREDCLGLCPTCGTDLNSDPCDGHGDDTDSPFAVLKDLFDS